MIVDLAGAEVVHVDHVEGGYSPCLAAGLTLADGRRVFVKAVSSEHNPDSPDFIRREITAVGILPDGLPVPSLLDSYDDGRWVIALFEHVAGVLPALPWEQTHLERALASLAALNAVAAPIDLLSANRFLAPLFDGWQQMAATDSAPRGWRARVDELVTLEARALELVVGDRLVHTDVRSDNMLVAGDGRFFFVDWAHACRGAPWLDLLLWLPALELEGGGPPEAVLAQAPDLLRPTNEQIVAVAVAVLGYFISRGALPDPPGLPTVRAFQRAQGEVTDRWVRRLLG